MAESRLKRSKRMQKMREQVRQRRRVQNQRAVTIALDAMGTDVGPEEMLRGAFDAVDMNPLISIVCTGPHDRLSRMLRTHAWEHPRIRIENAIEVVGMHEAPKESLKKKNSSVAVAARLVAEGKAHGMVSPGNTGATMATSLLQWRTLPGISRPAIAALFPHPERPCLLLDAGANVDCKPRHLFQFGLMGSVYMRYVLHRRNPRVGVLSIGEEETKGNELSLAASALLKKSTINFAGNAEGRDLMKGLFDVVVCDGFVGNVVLKFGEGMAEFLFENLREEFARNILSQLGAAAMMPVFKNFKRRVDYAEYGGAPLLGLRGTCIICHGSSRAKAIMNAIRVAAEMVGHHVNDHIVELVQQNTQPATTLPSELIAT